MLPEYSYTKSDSLAQISTLPWLKYRIFFSSGLFFYCRTLWIVWQSVAGYRTRNKKNARRPRLALHGAF